MTLSPPLAAGAWGLGGNEFREAGSRTTQARCGNRVERGSKTLPPT
jgi:hypothetical protein